MYIFNRELTLKPSSLIDGTAAMSDAVSHISASTGYDFSLWQALLGAPVGSLGVSAMVGEYGAYTDAVARAYAEDEAWLAKVAASGEHMASNPVDSLWNVVHAVGDMSEVPNVISSVAWQMNPAEVAPSVAWAVDLANYVNGVGGAPVSVSFSQWGLPNYVRLIWAYDSVAAFDEATSSVRQDPGFGERLAATAEIGVPRDMRTAVLRRIL
ncbi:MAG: hypothetical protein ISR43_00980 [Acidimicrobiia bacterium]|nr:hypothetical protein [Actinomycetota bacterium]MBL6924742.1 hypothetical protein [Acidimicrobiia bacterium]MBL6925786.1 hypothetical protein [Acidimicrobiia bacterium]